MIAIACAIVGALTAITLASLAVASSIDKRERDDEQRVSWVNLSERDSFMGRMLAHFSLFIIPAAR